MERKEMRSVFEKRTVDKVFNQITLRGCKNLISEAFNDLSANIREDNLNGTLGNSDLEVVRHKAYLMKKELTNFIDEQVRILENSTRTSGSFRDKIEFMPK